MSPYMPLEAAEQGAATVCLIIGTLTAVIFSAYSLGPLWVGYIGGFLLTSVLAAAYLAQHDTHSGLHSEA